jgi:metal-responsive CopG/Arc/MetJ family transcriptional regulator
MTMKTVSLTLPNDLNARLESAAKRRNSSKSEVVREALLRFLAGEEGQAVSSFVQQATLLIGCVEGPADLASNPKHLRGYGQ